MKPQVAAKRKSSSTDTGRVSYPVTYSHAHVESHLTTAGPGT